MAVTPGDQSPWTQGGAGVRFEWGLPGARALTPPGGVLVVVDVLSFTTSTTVAVGKGTAVYPHRWPDPDVDVFAAAHGAVRAARRHAVTADHPWSLSPTHLLAAPATPRLVLPSPNGSTIAASGEAGVVVAGCLRNATAVARWLTSEGFGTDARPVAVIAAGERWPTGNSGPPWRIFSGPGPSSTPWPTKAWPPKPGQRRPWPRRRPGGSTGITWPTPCTGRRPVGN